MTTEQQAQKIDKLEARIKRLERYFKIKDEQSDWINKNEASALCGLSPETLRKYSYKGKLKTRIRSSGRGVMYSKKQIQEMFQ
jgi:helix-turn-helix protein